MKNVLLIAGFDQKYYFAPFVRACEERHVRLFVLDPDRAPKLAALCVRLDADGALSGFIDVGQCSGDSLEDTRLAVSDIDIAWYLREGAAQREAGERLIEERFADNESRAALRSFYSALGCSWVNRQETVHFLASNKLYQQQVARRCGLSIPRTLITNDPDSVADFSDPKEGLLLKSIGYTHLDDEGRYFLYSQRFSHGELTAAPSAIRRCPIFCQEYVDKRYEHRVMAIGSRILACRIDSQASPLTRIDWRHYDLDNVEHVQVELPGPVQAKLLRFMSEVGLRFGAIDLIETPDGDFVFLEVNPSGQWGWIADLAGLPIPAAVADMLRSM